MSRTKRPAASALLAQLSLAGIRLFGGPKGTRILCYHRVNDSGKGYLCVSPAEFRRQMEWLAAEGYRTAGLSDLLQGTVSEKSVIITFDDGYEDNYLHAFPVMRDLGFTGTIFLIAKRIGEPEFLKISEIEEMMSFGFCFGSHTLNHPNLRKISREDKLRELGDSKFVIEKLLGRPCDFFCYPFGHFDEETLSVVRGVGYKAACSNTPGVNASGFNPQLLRRTEIAAHDTLGDFKNKMAGAYDSWHKLLHTLRGRP